RPRPPPGDALLPQPRAVPGRGHDVRPLPRTVPVAGRRDPGPLGEEPRGAGERPAVPRRGERRAHRSPAARPAGTGLRGLHMLEKNKVSKIRTGEKVTTPRFEEVGAVSARDLTPVVDAVTRPASEAAEEFRILRAKIRTLDEERPLRCIGMVSATEGEGKSTMTLGLATALAQEPDRRVLLIDCDLRKPAVERYLGLKRIPGLGEWLQGQSSALPIRRVEPQDFFLLGPGLVTNERPELLGSERMASLLALARQSFDVVLLDCSPLVPVADSVILQDLVDGFLFVVRARRSPREMILKGLSHLKGDRVRGTIFNGHREVLPGYKTYGYRRYGEYR